jgi:hypothetical protein
MCSVDRSSKAASGRWLLAMALAATAGAAACSRSSSDEEIASAEVPTIAAETGTVEKRDLVEALLVRGSVTAPPNEDVKLAAQVAGRVVAMRGRGRQRARRRVWRRSRPPARGPAAPGEAAFSQARARERAAHLARTERFFERHRRGQGRGRGRALPVRGGPGGPLEQARPLS